VLGNPKKLIVSVTEWIDGDNSTGESAWGYEGEIVQAPISDMTFAMWDKARQGGGLSMGDWLSLPLTMLAKYNAIDLTYSTWQYIRAEESDWSKLTGTQTELIRQVEKWQATK
jgi:hypothetical protein